MSQLPILDQTSVGGATPLSIPGINNRNMGRAKRLNHSNMW